jgi:hypothetical protein
VITHDPKAAAAASPGHGAPVSSFVNWIGSGIATPSESPAF